MTGFTKSVRELIGMRALDFNHSWPVCEIMAICQGHRAVAAHHRRPRGAGGSRRADTNRAANGLATCDPCHAWVESNRDKARGYGWLVAQHETPADVPVLRRGRWVLLGDDGALTATTSRKVVLS